MKSSNDKPIPGVKCNTPPNGKNSITDISKLSIAAAEQKTAATNMMTLKAWPQFIQSEDYRKWRADKGIDYDDHSVRSCDAINEIDSKAWDENQNQNGNELSFLEKVDKEFEDIINNQAWLVQLLETVETLPLCVSIATARKGKRGFPLVYVNRFFETTTGYTREEILGQNCRFLQKGEC